MAKRYRTTGCAKLFFVLLIIAPIAFFVASYVNGKDPMQAISNIFGSTSSEKTEVVKEVERSDVEDKDQKIRMLEKDVEFYRLEVENLKTQLEDCQSQNN